MKQVIFTADDFGLSPAVNAAIELAHREGILNSTSLMVGEPAAADAVARARRNPALRVGLHLVVGAGKPVLPVQSLAAIVDGDGRLSRDFVRAGFQYFFSPTARRQLAAEIRAQFAAFQATGLELDHVDAHHHLHLHPTVLGLLLEVGRDYGLRAVRLPAEPPLLGLLDQEAGALQRRLQSLLLAPWIALVRSRLRRAGIASTDYIAGLYDTGRMSIERLEKILHTLPEGSVEIFFHPAQAELQGPWPLAPAACQAELDALMSPRARAALYDGGIRQVSFSDLAAARP